VLGQQEQKGSFEAVALIKPSRIGFVGTTFKVSVKDENENKHIGKTKIELTQSEAPRVKTCRDCGGTHAHGERNVG